MTREKKLKPDLPSGFVDKKGSELILKDKLTEIIKKNFQLYGYEQISTPSFEFSENIGKKILNYNEVLKSAGTMDT